MNMKRVYIGWGFSKSDKDAVVNCGEYATVGEAESAVAAAGLDLAEIESEYRKEAPAEEFKVSPTNTANYSAHYFYGYGATREAAVIDALRIAKVKLFSARNFMSAPLHIACEAIHLQVAIQSAASPEQKTVPPSGRGSTSTPRLFAHTKEQHHEPEQRTHGRAVDYRFSRTKSNSWG